MPKVLIVIARLNVGGTAQYIAELVKGFEPSKYEVLVATGHVQGAEVEDAVVASLPIVRIPNMGRRISLFADLKARRELKKLLRSLSRILFILTPLKLVCWHAALKFRYRECMPFMAIC